MRILQVCAYLYPALQYGGPAKVVYDVSRELSKNHRVAVLTSDVWSRDRRITSNERIVSSHNFKIIYSQNVINSIAYTHRFFTCFSMIFYFLRNRTKFDIVHIHDIFILPQLCIAFFAEYFGLKVILSPHGILDPIRLQKKSLSKSLLFKFLVYPIAIRAEKIIATSEKEKHDLIKLGFERVVVVENCIPSISVKASNCYSYLKSQKLTLLYIGKLHSQKGIIELLRAIVPYSDAIELILAGPDDGMEFAIKQFISKNKLPNVHVLGFVSDAEKAELFSLSDMFVYPSFAEGFSISILEALQAGLPAITTTGCNFKMVETERAGYIVPTNNLTAELSKVLHAVLLKREKLLPMKKNAIALVKNKYSIDKMAQQLHEIYEK